MTLAPAPLRRLALVAGLVALLAASPAARAHDAAAPAPPPPVAGSAARLSPAELAVLRRRFPEWDRWDAATRDRVAASVIRLRGLSPEQRARLLDRGRRLDRAGPGAAETFAHKLSEWSRFGPDDRQRLLQADVTARAISAQMLGRLPAAVREAALPATEAPGAAGVGLRVSLGIAIGRAWRERALAPLVARPPLDAEPGAASPPPRAQALRDLRETVRAAGGAAAPEDLRRRYASAVLEDRVAAVRQAAFRSAGPSSPADRLAAYGVGLRDLDAGAFDAVLADLEQAASRGPEGLERFRDRHLPGRQAFRARAMWELVWALESRRHDLAGDPLAKADDLLASLLAALDVPAEQIGALRAEARPLVRMRLLREMHARGR